MGLLPEIVDGQLVETAEDKQFKRFTDSHEYKEKRRKLAEHFDKLKAKHALKEVDKNLGELNNEGHTLVTEDFSDSPHADSEPIEEEDSDESLSAETD